MRSRPADDVTVALLTHDRRDDVLTVLDRLEQEPHAGIVVVDSGSSDGTAEAVEALGRSDVVVRRHANIAVAGRNDGVEAATTRYVLLLDDDAYPLPGTIVRLVRALDARPDLAVASGRMVDVTHDGEVVRDVGVGTFDWFLRAGRTDDGDEAGLPTFFFSEGGCLVRREAFLAVGGFFPAYFFTLSELDLTIRLADRGWGVHYVPDAVVHHLKPAGPHRPSPLVLELRTRNEVWFWLRHFPWPAALAGIAFYTWFGLVEAVHRRQVAAWARGLRAAWHDRSTALDTREIRSADARRLVTKGRAGLHLRVLGHQLRRRLPGARQPVAR